MQCACSDVAGCVRLVTGACSSKILYEYWAQLSCWQQAKNASQYKADLHCSGTLHLQQPQKQEKHLAPELCLNVLLSWSWSSSSSSWPEVVQPCLVHVPKCLHPSGLLHQRFWLKQVQPMLVPPTTPLSGCYR